MMCIDQFKRSINHTVFIFKLCLSTNKFVNLVNALLNITYKGFFFLKPTPRSIQSSPLQAVIQ